MINRIILFPKNEINHIPDNTVTSHSIDIKSTNNSAGESRLKDIYYDLPNHHFSTIRKENSSKKNLVSTLVHHIIHTTSNQNVNRAKTNSFRTINSHIIVTPASKTNCQKLVNLRKSENGYSDERLTDILSHRLYQQRTYINHRICCDHCRLSFHPCAPIHHSESYAFSATSQKQIDPRNEISLLSKRSSCTNNSNENQSSTFAASKILKSKTVDMSYEYERFSSNTTCRNEANKWNRSVLSFPDHGTPQSQLSEVVVSDDEKINLNAQKLVDDSIRNAQDKYQKLVMMNPNYELKLDKSKINKPSFDNTLMNKEILADENKLCQELCTKLNLSNLNQVNEIIRLLDEYAPYMLKEQFSLKHISINNSNTNNVDDGKSVSNQLLFYPPFKPKRLIHLSRNGSIQLLSATDEHQTKSEQRYHMNYSNSALTNASSFAFECDPILSPTINFKTYSKFISTQHNQFLKSKVHRDYLSTIENKSILSIVKKNENLCEQDNRIININLDINDEIIQIESEDDQNSLPDIVVKRIVTPSSVSLHKSIYSTNDT